MISNHSLFIAASRIGLPSFILSKPLVAKLWQPINPYLTSSAETSKNKPDNASSSVGSQVSTRLHGRSRLLMHLAVCSSWYKTLATHPGKRGKRKKQRDEHDFQWLGDKVGRMSSQRLGTS